jgi:hypothetical protein
VSLKKTIADFFPFTHTGLFVLFNFLFVKILKLHHCCCVTDARLFAGIPKQGGRGGAG